MATVTHANTKRMYSWWWDSHISPKNSKWLQENLTDMDVKVKQMIKLIEEDADSFARRAEMYYKKRPELMKLVEEFYRAYRALAERYDHATGALRQAHRTMAEAFPNQVPFVLGDESPGSFGADCDPRTPDMPPIRALFDSDDLQKDAIHSVKRNGDFTQESDSVVGRKGLKPFNDLFGSGDHAKFSEGRVRKGLNFHDVEEKERGLQNYSSQDRVSKAEQEISTLKDALSKLEAEKEAGLLQYQESLERLSNLQSEVSRAKENSERLSERASKAEAEVQNLKEAIAKLEADRETSFVQYQQCLEKISRLEENISHAQRDAGELNERAEKAEVEAESLKQNLGGLKVEKEAALGQYNKCLERISDLEDKLLHAEEDARRFSDCAHNAESEVETLKQEVAKLTEDKEAALVQYQKCLEIISSLEHKLACVQEEAERLHSEIDVGVEKLKGAEERCLLLERSNQTMHSELESLAQKVAAQTEELTEKQQEVGRLWACVQDERLRFVEAETAFQTLQDLHSQSQEELRSMATQLQNRIKMLEELEACHQSLQNEVEQVKVDNKSLNEVNLSSALTVQNLQDEIAGLRDTIRKLEAEVELRVDQRNALQQEIYCLKKELNDLTKQHQEIVEQVESVGYRPDCFGSSVKDMQDENAKLKEVCERDRTEKIALKEKLETMEKLVEKHALLENSLSDLNVELEEVRGKVKALEESCQSLMAEKSTLLSEKATLVSQLQVATDNLEKLVEKNNFLENSLHDANAEIEELRLKFKSLEDTCLSLENEKFDLATVKGSLISQLETTGGKLESLEKNYMELEKKYLSLEKERESALNKVGELQGHLDNEKHVHARLAELNESEMAGMASQICLLKQEGQHKIKLYEEELDKGLSSEVEIFVLQKCIQDLEGKNFSLLLECQKLLEASKLSDKVISELEHENCKQQVEVKSLFDKIKLLRMGLYRVLAALNLDANQCCKDNADQDQTLLSHVLKKLEETQESLFMAEDEKQKLVIENSIFVALLEQLQLEVESLMTAKGGVDEELRTRCEQLSVLHIESQKLKEMNEGLKLKIMEGDHREEVLMVELKNVHGQLLDLQGAHQELHEENCKVLEEKTFLTQSLSDLGEEKCDLEEEICAIFAETVSQGFLSLIFGDIISRKDKEIEDLSGNLDKLGYVNNDLKEMVKVMEGKLDQLTVLGNENRELHQTVCDMKCKHDEAEAIRAKQENQITKLSGDCDQQRAELQKLHGELLEYKSRGEILNQQLQNERNEVALWESQAVTFLGELQISQVQEALFEGKVSELTKACETFEDAHCSKALEIDQLKERVSTLEGENGELKARMRAYVPAFISLKDCITSLENHTISRATRQKADKKGEKDAPIDGHTENCRQMDEEGEGSAMAPSGLLELEQLQTRIRTLEKALMERERLLMLENLSANSKLEAAIRQIEELKSGRKLRREAGGAAASNDLRLEKRTHEISEEPSEVMTKDIMLDQVSDCSSHGFGRREMIEADRMLEVWGTDYQEGSIDLTVGKAQKGATAPAKKKHHRDHPSAESLFEKEVAVDKLEISKNFSGSRQEGNERKVLERLDSDAQKLTNLQITVQDLKRKVEICEKSKNGKGVEYDSVKEQLEESEETIIKLFDLNRELLKTIEDDSMSFDEKSSSASDEKGSIRGRKIGEQARRVSEKIGRLQLEVQKLQFLLLKLDDGNKSRSTTKITERKTRVLLRDYLYGRTRTSPRRKKGHFCACVQPRTHGD